MGLSKAAIVQAALDVLNEAGMDGVTVRAVARRLGVQAPALYWHVKNKQELLDEMGTEIWRRVSQELVALGPGFAWREGLIAYATIVRRALLSHRDGAKAFSGTYLTDVSVLQRQELVFAQMSDAGFTLEDTVRAYTLLYSFTVGFCIEEQAVAASTDDRYAARQAERPYIFGDPDARFTDLVDVIVGSIERMQTRRTRD